ncbi:hypothetical protein LCGC14_1841020 [marine sediment metagenome]|uniref:Uncharacterized protein n=1 Tax=marine sediment metagenome TaxID=412755 RepID=A0A0F9GDE4_9ZZZZ
MSYDRGDPVEFEVNSADASTAAALVLREAGLRTSRTLASDERLVIESVSGYMLAADAASARITAVITADTDEDGDLDAGDLMFAFGGGGFHGSFPQGMAGALGIIPKVLATASGLVRLSGAGYIMKG